MKKYVTLVLCIILLPLFEGCNPNEDTGENLTPGDLLSPIDNSHDLYFLNNNTLYGVRDNNDPGTNGVGQMEAFLETKISSVAPTVATPVVLRISEDLNGEAGGYGPLHLVVASGDGIVYMYNIPGGELIWQTDLVEEIRTTPSVISFLDGSGENAYLFLGTTRGTFYCLNAKDGSIVWAFEEPNRIGFENAAASSLTGRICVATGRGTLYTFNTQGTLLWSFETQILMQSKPVMYETLDANGITYSFDSVIGGTLDGIIFRLDGATGNEIWSRNLGEPIVSAPFLPNRENNFGNTSEFYVNTLSRRVHKILMDNGDSSWFTALDASSYSTPVYFTNGQLSTQNNYLYATSDKSIFSLDLLAGGAINWSVPLDPPVYATPNVVSSFNNGSGTRIYINSKVKVTGINAQTGLVFSEFNIPGAQNSEGDNPNFQSSPVVIYNESDFGLTRIYHPRNVL